MSDKKIEDKFPLMKQLRAKAETENFNQTWEYNTLVLLAAHFLFLYGKTNEKKAFKFHLPAVQACQRLQAHVKLNPEDGSFSVWVDVGEKENEA